MPHNIYIRDGRPAIFVTGEPAWHGLGTVLQRPATAAEAIQAANLNWTVSKQPVYAGDGQRKLIPDYFAVVRDDTWKEQHEPAVLGVVGSNYTPLQNRDAFTFFDPIVGDHAAVYHTAGALGSGERVWILAKLPTVIRVIGDDIADKYLLLSNSHDGNSAVQVKFTPIRVVCENTLTQALSEGPSLRVAHTRDLRERLRMAAVMLAAVQRRFDELANIFQRMARVPMAQAMLTEYLLRVFPDPRPSHDEARYERAKRQVQGDRGAAAYFFDNGKNMELRESIGTLWAAYNGVAEYIDHGRFTKGTPDRRLNGIWFGEGYSIKARAFTIAEKSLSAWAN
jgi:phage/plasmid-like protein (TIGR03299 family)